MGLKKPLSVLLTCITAAGEWLWQEWCFFPFHNRTVSTWQELFWGTRPLDTIVTTTDTGCSPRPHQDSLLRKVGYLSVRLVITWQINVEGVQRRNMDQYKTIFTLCTQLTSDLKGISRKKEKIIMRLFWYKQTGSSFSVLFVLVKNPWFYLFWLNIHGFICFG